MDGITVETAEGGILHFKPESLRIPSVRGGKGRQIAPDLKRVVPPRIAVVDWEELERREAAGEVITPGNAPMIGVPKPKPKADGGFW